MLSQLAQSQLLCFLVLARGGLKYVGMTLLVSRKHSHILEQEAFLEHWQERFLHNHNYFEGHTDVLIPDECILLLQLINASLFYNK